MHIISQQKKKIVEWICGNGIAEIRGKKKLLQLVCGNAIAKNGRGKKIIVAEIWGGIKKKMLRPQYFYNIFTTNYR